MSDKSLPITEPIDATDDHEFGYAYGKAAFQNGTLRKIRLDKDFAAFLQANKITSTTAIRQAWIRGWNNASEAAAMSAKITPPSTR